jgi:hypothetical protein
MPEQLLNYLSAIPMILQQLAAYVAIAVASIPLQPVLLASAAVFVVIMAVSMLKSLFQGLQSFFAKRKEKQELPPPAPKQAPYAMELEPLKPGKNVGTELEPIKPLGPPPPYSLHDPNLQAGAAGLQLVRPTAPPPYVEHNPYPVQKPNYEPCHIALNKDMPRSGKTPIDIIELDAIEQDMQALAEKINRGDIFKDLVLMAKDGRQYGLSARYEATTDSVTLCKRPLNPQAGEGISVITKTESESGWREQIASAFVDLAYQQQKQPQYSGFEYQGPQRACVQVLCKSAYQGWQARPSAPAQEQAVESNLRHAF